MNNLRLKAMTDGLGFHQKKDSSHSSELPPIGATAAGRALPIMPPKTFPSPAPLRSTLNSTPTFSKSPASAVSIEERTFPQPFINGAQLSTKVAAPLLIEESTYGLGYVFRRCAAYLVDFTLHTLLIGSLIAYFLLSSRVSLAILSRTDTLLLLGSFVLFFHWTLLTALEITTHCSVGKYLFQLKLEGTSSQILKRSIAFIPGLISIVGLVWGLFSNKNKCFHDITSECQPEDFVQFELAHEQTSH